LVTSASAVTLGCPANLKSSRYLRHFGTHCYEFILNHPGDWFHADSDCRAKGGYLVDIHSTSEQAFIYNSLQVLGLHGDKGVWIGLTDKDREGTWKWTSGTNVNFRNWDKGQPGLFGGSEDCALLEASSDGKWGDYPCEGILFVKQRHGWVCKFAEVPLTTKMQSTMMPTTVPATSTMNTKETMTLSTAMMSSTPVETAMTSTPMKTMMTSTPIETMMTSTPVKTMMTSTPVKTMMTSTPMATMMTSTLMKTMMTSIPMKTTMMSTPMKTMMTSTPVKTVMTSTPMATMMTSTLMKTMMTSTPMKTMMTSTPMNTAASFPATSVKMSTN
ncbi:uncharacterized protein LOC123526936, partial [Mercenaria mercenaria]|uniref:uncharacterized protein LOC123526936 n=1 Tax=Mercenaria mercenaria TaxID=6596 RepID=UPI00234EAB58